MLLSKRNLIIAVAIFVALFFVLAAFSLKSSIKPKASPTPTPYVDPGSGETIKTDKSNSETNAVIYPGFSQLLDRGLSPAQIQSIQSMIMAYSNRYHKDFKEISLQVNTVRHILPQGNSRTQTLNFDIVTNRTATYYISATYENTDTIQSTLYASDQKTVLFQQ